MIILGLILWVVGQVFNIDWLLTVGWVVGAIGVVLLILGLVGMELGGRRYWY